MDKFERVMLIVMVFDILVIAMTLVKPGFDIARLNANIQKMAQQVQNTVNAQLAKQDKLEIRIGKIELEIQNKKIDK